MDRTPVAGDDQYLFDVQCAFLHGIVCVCIYIYIYIYGTPRLRPHPPLGPHQGGFGWDQGPPPPILGSENAKK